MTTNSFGTICRWAIALWTAFCASQVLWGLLRVGDQVLNAHTDAEKIGTGLGIALGIGADFMLWIIPTMGLLVFYLAFGRSFATAGTPRPMAPSSPIQWQKCGACRSAVDPAWDECPSCRTQI